MKDDDLEMNFKKDKDLLLFFSNYDESEYSENLKYNSFDEIPKEKVVKFWKEMQLEAEEIKKSGFSNASDFLDKLAEKLIK